MKRFIIIFALVCISVLGLLEKVFATEIEISGVVENTQGNAEQKVTVSVWREGKIIKSKDTDDKGSYSIKISSGSTIDQIQYKRDDLDIDNVPRICGNTNQKISKVMYRPGESRPVFATLNTIEAYERFALITLEADPSIKEEINKQFIGFNPAGKIDSLKIPKTMTPTTQNWLRYRRDLVIKLVIDTEKIIQ